jgi:ribonucleotide monophosphatase NagD (HAD superfamily)
LIKDADENLTLSNRHQKFGMKDLSSLRGILFDLDGVLYVGPNVIEGAITAITDIKLHGYRCGFITNTSTLSSASLQKKLIGLRFDIAEIISATRAARIYLQQFDDPICHLLLSDDVKQDFQRFSQSDSKADFVIIGDIGDAWSYKLLNNVFNLLINGAQLIAIHKKPLMANRTRTANGYRRLHQRLGIRQPEAVDNYRQTVARFFSSHPNRIGLAVRASRYNRRRHRLRYR